MMHKYLLIVKSIFLKTFFFCKIDKIRGVNFLLKLFEYWKSQRLSSEEMKLFNDLKMFRPKAGRFRKKEVLVQVVDDYEYIIKVGAASKALADHFDAKTSLMDPYFVKQIGWKSEVAIRYEELFGPKCVQIAKGFGNKLVFSNERLFSDQKIIKKTVSEITKKVKSREDLIDLKHGDYQIGDLIYDTYLRYYNKTTVDDLNCKDLRHLYEITFNIIFSFEKFLNSRNIVCFVTTYTSYISSGLAARIALARGIKVYSLASHSYLIKELSKQDPYHLFDYSTYDPNLKLNKEKMEKYEQLFKNRFSGKVDDSISYMRSAAYSQNGEVSNTVRQQFSNGKLNLIFYVHDFYDSPHVSQKLLFNDLYSFFDESVRCLAEVQGINVWIKLHPNSVGDSNKLVEELVNNLNKEHIAILPTEISNLQIIELKPDLVVTYRGTVASEMAYHQIPVLALKDCPYMQFSFAHCCETKEEYFTILRDPRLIGSLNQSHEHIFSFFFQHYDQKLEKLKNENLVRFLFSFPGNSSTIEYLKYIDTRKQEIFNPHFYKEYLDNILILE